MFKYQKLYEELKQLINQGIYKPGDKLPSENELSKAGYGRPTVRHALALLEEDGLIHKRRGSQSIVGKSAYTKNNTGKVAIVFRSFSLYIFPETLRGINEGIKGWATPILYSTDGKIEKEEEILKELLQIDIDGVIVQASGTAMPNPNLPLYQALIDKGIPLIFLYTYYPSLTGFLYVGNEDKQGGYEAVKILYKAGRRKIGGMFTTDMLQMHQRYQGYIEACKELGVPINSDRQLWVQGRDLSNSSNLKPSILFLAEQCDAIVCVSDNHASIVINTLIEAGYNIPNDMAVISFDNSRLCDYAPVPISSLDGNAFQIGKVAAHKIKNIQDGKIEYSESFSWKLVERNSI